MPDFTARLTAGVVPAVWDDHEGSGVSRINPRATHPSKFLKATVFTPVTLKATIGGVEGPTDAALPDPTKLFTSDFAEHPSPSPISPTGVGGSSSIQQFTPLYPGHYLWVIRHADGGAVAIHLDAE